MRLWTGFGPPIPPFADDPAVARYADDVRSIDSEADVESPLTEGPKVAGKLVEVATRGR